MRVRAATARREQEGRKGAGTGKGSGESQRGRGGGGCRRGTEGGRRAEAHEGRGDLLRDSELPPRKDPQLQLHDRATATCHEDLGRPRYSHLYDNFPAGSSGHGVRRELLGASALQCKHGARLTAVPQGGRVLNPRPRYVFDQTPELFDSHRQSAEPPGERR